ncbi:hypothetical protein ACQ4XT_13490 [Halobacillus faecis]
MLTIITYILFIPLILSFLHWATFMNTEGKDERGQIILGRVSQVTWGLIIFGGAILLIIDILFTLSKTSFQQGLLILFSIVMIVNSTSIYRIKKTM